MCFFPLEPAPAELDKAKAMFDVNYPRFQGIKKRYDPENIFNRWFPIMPAWSRSGWCVVWCRGGKIRVFREKSFSLPPLRIVYSQNELPVSVLVCVYYNLL
jgi:hypothetical protein